MRPIRRMLVLAAVALLGCREAPKEPLAIPDVSAPVSVSATTVPIRVLLLGDLDIAGTDSLDAALRRAGYQVTRRPGPEYTWNGTDPALTDFDAVVHLDGATFYASLSASAQQQLVDFVNRGGRYITDQYTQYEVRNSLGQTLMTDLALQQWGGSPSDNCLTCTITYTMDPARAGHPIMAGIPASFAFFADGHDAGVLATFATRPVVVLMRAPHGNPGVSARHLGQGCVTNFSFAANQGAAVGYTLQDPNVQRLFINAVGWDCAQDADPPRITLNINPTSLWPANHKMVLVAKGITAIDDVDGAPQFDVSVTAAEGKVQIGLNKNNPDWNIVRNADGSVDVWLRAERTNSVTGRVYTITATSTDSNGNTDTKSGIVTVPKDSK